MGRTNTKHLKRLNAPSSWMLSKLGGIFAPKPAAGPHKGRECLPLSLILRNRLKYALTRKESMMIVMKKAVRVDGKVRTELNYPAGFMDVVTIEGTGDAFRMLYDTKGRFVLHKIGEEEKGFKLARVVGLAVTSKNIPYVVTHDGRTIRYPDPLIKVHDTVKIDLATGKIVDTLKFEVGCTVMITRGRNTGRVGVFTSRETHEGSFDIAHVKDAAGTSFATRLGNAFAIGKGADASKALVSLPRGNGIKQTIFDERAKRSGTAKA
jgi:small subunit ribosomal protein S4e